MMFDEKESWGTKTLELLVGVIEKMWCSQYRALRMLGVVLVVPWCMVSLIVALPIEFLWYGWSKFRPLLGEIKNLWDGPICPEEKKNG